MKIRALTIAGLLSLAACVPPTSGDQPSNSTAADSNPTTTADAATTTRAASIAPPTEPPTTAIPPTEPPLPPAPTATATRFVTPADATDAVIESVNAVVTNDAGTATFLAGIFHPGPGTPAQATVWVSDGRARAATVTLDNAGAEESWANGIATRGDQVLVAGTTRVGDRTTGVLWQSDDGGTTFGPPQVIDDELTNLRDIGYGDQNPVAIGTIQPAGQRPTPVALIGAGDTWTRTVLEGPDQRWINALTVNGASILVTGGSRIDGDDTAALWVSTDGGAAFTAIDSVSSYRKLGAVTAHNGTYVTSARGKNDDPMAILTSSDGLAWSPTEVRLTWRGEPWASRYVGGERVVVADDGSYVTEVGSGFGFIGRISPDGNGQAFDIFNGRQQVDENLIPFAIGGQVSFVSNTERSFAIFSQSSDGWEYTGPVTAEGPTVTWTELQQVGGALAVRAVSYPKVAKDGGSHASSTFWSRFDGELLAPMTTTYLPGDVSSWIANDTVEVALNAGAADPLDAHNGGPFGGTVVWTRQLPDGVWSDQSLILSGPGADILDDIDPMGPGFVAVGYRNVSEVNKISTSTPVVIEYLDGVWNTASLPTVGGNKVSLYDAVGAGSGLALAIGSSNDPAIIGPLVLSRGTDGVWTRIDLPVNDAGAYVISSSFDDDRFELLIYDAGTYAVLTSVDGKTFDRSELNFADPFLANPSATARIDGVTYVVGFAGTQVAYRLAIWQLNGDGTLTPIDVVGDAPLGDIWIDSVEVIGSDIWLGGQQSKLGVVWKLNVAGVAAEAETPAIATTAPPAATTAPPAATTAG